MATQNTEETTRTTIEGTGESHGQRDLQVVIQKLSREMISAGEARKVLREAWDEAYEETLIRKLLRELLPLFSRTYWQRPHVRFRL